MNNRKKSGPAVMLGLLRLLKPLNHVMLLCITLGTLGFFAAIFITVLAAHLLLTMMGQSPWHLGAGFTIGLMLLFAVARAGLRYGEQTCGHYIAFKLLAVVRDRVFGALRILAPAKLEGRGRGDLVALITSDIELLEVFYAHTIAPVCIATVVSVVMSLMIGSFHPLLGLLAAASYLLVGVLVPLATARLGREYGRDTRAELGRLNNAFLENLRGMREVLQYGQAEKRAAEIREKTERLNGLQKGIRIHEGTAASWSGLLVMVLPAGMLLAGMALDAGFPAVILSTVMLASSFGPVLALSNLSAAMDSTLAAGERVLNLLDEEPLTPEVQEGAEPAFTGAAVRDLSFAYGREEVLCHVSAEFPEGQIVAVTGRSGSGKSTLLKLLMRFWQAPRDSVTVSGMDVGDIRTGWLREMESYMTQETSLFNVSVEDNIRIGKQEASHEEVEAAARMASIHERILALPQGYETPLGELGDLLSEGEKQRIGLARAFLHGAPLMLLDEPTSNLDSLNEGMILRALREDVTRSGRTVILVSHRRSTLSIADRSCTLADGRFS